MDSRKEDFCWLISEILSLLTHSCSKAGQKGPDLLQPKKTRAIFFQDFGFSGFFNILPLAEDLDGVKDPVGVGKIRSIENAIIADDFGGLADPVFIQLTAGLHGLDALQ